MSIPQQIHDANQNSRVVMAIFDEATKRWFFSYSLYNEDEVLYTVTTSQSSLFDACRQAETAKFAVDSEFAAGKLLLPDMGDWTVEYPEG